jgi:hypothetical protein
MSMPVLYSRVTRRCEMAKKFMYVCLGLLMLAIAYHLGAGQAESDQETPFVSLCSINGRNGNTWALLALAGDGTVYKALRADPREAFPEWKKWGSIIEEPSRSTPVED